MIKSINPSTEEVIREFSFAHDKEIEAALDKGVKAFGSWGRLGFSERAKFLVALSDGLLAEIESLARMATLEMGKPITEARAEVKKCADACRHFANFSADYLKDEILVEREPKAFVTYQPLGLIFGIMPWNFPYWQVIRFAAPTLMAGNAVMIKHAPNTFGCAEALNDVFKRVGFAEGVYQNLRATVEQAWTIIQDRRCAGVSLTGSTAAGRSVGAAAGQALKRYVLELGGSDAYVVLDDADMELAADRAVRGRMLNGGQSCIAAKRWIVTGSRYDEFKERVSELMRDYKTGDPLSEACRLGPMARMDLRDQLHRQVQTSVKSGAQLKFGGEIPDRRGFYYPPTLLTDVRPGQPAFDEELFGPVASLIKAKDESEALRLANLSNYGLGAAIFSKDIDRAEKLARTELQAGVCFVNDFVRSDSRWPFGGVKDSGVGRELSMFGIREFVNVKSVVR